MRLQLVVIFLLFRFLGVAQELPPIIKYAPEDYAGDNQNWMISQADSDVIYVANNKGLLEFNGSNWTMYESPNNTIIRAVKVVGDKIYTGCYAEFGYWIKDKKGQLNYRSLISLLRQNLVEDEQIWNIMEYGVYIIFQSNKALYFYNSDTEEFSITPSNNLIYKIFKVENQIYYHVANEGIYKFEAGVPKLLIEDSKFQSDRIINIFPNDHGLLLISRSNGFLQWQDGELMIWDKNIPEVFKSKSVFSSIQLSDGSFMLGTISNGLIHLTAEGVLKYQITQKRGLGNNTVLSLFEDEKHNVWTGLDNGINCVNVRSPIATYFDFEGILGTVYVSKVHNNILYLGTNQGLFYREISSADSDFKFVEGTAGQVLSLYVHQGKDLLCGHHLGTFLIKGNQANQISSELGAWKFESLPDRNNVLLQGNYNGLYVLSKEQDDWRLKNKVQGFNNSSRYFEIINDHEVLVSHEFKGVFRLSLDDDYTKVENTVKITALPHSKNSGLNTYKNKILFSSEKGIYEYHAETGEIKKDTILSALFDDQQYVSGKMVTDEEGRLWLFTKDNLNYITTDHVNNLPRIKKLAIPGHLRKGALGYENVSLINSKMAVMGTSNGYLTIDLSKFDSEDIYDLYLNEIVVEKLNGENKRIPKGQDLELEHQSAAVIFKYSVPNYEKYRETKYQYRLVGFQDQWSSWQTASSVKFENLSSGAYRFEVRAKIGNQQTETVEQFSFSVNRPWYLSNLLLVTYLGLLLLIILLTHRAYKRYYHKRLEHEQLENQQIIMEIKNEKLNQEIESKNRELAISTMSIIKKNEVLNKIKKELKKQSDKTDTSTALDLIDTNLNNSKDWKFFKQAFNNADKDFLDKIKARHPDLTPNDLRFCAYLRLNLSSKEIAPLLNISTKSVETKRYRLRKRLQLEHDQSLVNYILKF